MAGAFVSISVSKKVVRESLIVTHLSVLLEKPGTNSDFVLEVTKRVETLALKGGQLVLIEGPLPEPVAFVLAHGLADKFEAIACMDRHSFEYVVCVSRHRSLVLGHIIPSAAVSDWIPAKSV